MNLNLLKIKFIILLLVIGAYGGMVDDVYGKIKDTASGLRQDVRNVLNYGKGMIGLDDPEQEHKDGLIGGKIHSIQHTVHEFWHVDEIPNDSGLLWNMYNRFKQRLARAKDYVLGDDKDSTETTSKVQDPETILIHETMDKLFNADGTRKIEGKAFNDIVDNLRKQLRELRPQLNNKEDSLAIQSVPNYIQNKAVDDVQTLKENTEKTTEATPALKPEKSDGVVGLKDNTLDATTKE